MKKTLLISLIALHSLGYGYCDASLPPCISFSGLYFGGNVGVAAHMANRSDLDDFFSFGDPASWTISETNAIGGVQLGYDWQWFNGVIGLVWDGDWVNTKNNITLTSNGLPVFNKNQVNWFSTLRARLGLTINNALVYMTGGAAAARLSTKFDDGIGDVLSYQDTKWGWAGGVGTEFLLDQHWSVGCELLFLELAHNVHTFTLGSGDFSFENSDKITVGRIFANYRFGNCSVPSFVPCSVGVQRSSPSCFPCPQEDFNGFYVGGNAGAAAHSAHRQDLDNFLVFGGPTSWSVETSNVEGGIQGGYDWQCGSILSGIVWDWNWINTTTHHTIFPSRGTPEENQNSVNWVTTMRGRFGFTVSNALIYGTAGAAGGRFRTIYDDGLGDIFRDVNTAWGWTAGAGAELLLGCNWSLGLDLLYCEFDNRIRRAFDEEASFAFNHNDQLLFGRILINYRFGNPFN